MTMHGDKPIFSQSQEGATLEPYDPTLREKTEAVIRDLLTEYGGLSSGGARNIAQGITGTTDPSQGIAESLGVLDFLGGGLIFGPQEIKRDFERAQSGVDYIAPTVGGVLTVAESLPFLSVVGKPVSKSVKGFLSNLSRKGLADERNLQIPKVEEPLITSPGKKTIRDDETNVKPPDLSRRKFIQGAASVPVAAGALSNIPVGKIIDDVAPVVKKAIPKLPTDFTSLSSFKNALDNIHESVGIDQANMMTKKELKEIGIADPDDMIDDDYIKIGRMVEEESSFPMADTELLSMDSDNIKKWLNGEITLDEVDTGSVPVAGPVLKQLEEVYKLDKKQIKDYLIENEILDTD